MTSQTVTEEFPAQAETPDVPHQQKAGNLALIQSIEQIPGQRESVENVPLSEETSADEPNKQAVSFLKVLTKGYELPEGLTQRDAEMFTEMILGIIHEVKKPGPKLTPARESDEIVRQFVRGHSYDEISERLGNTKTGNAMQVWTSLTIKAVHERGYRPRKLHGMLEKFVALEEGPAIRPVSKPEKSKSSINKNTRSFLTHLINGYELPSNISQADAELFLEATFGAVTQIKKPSSTPIKEQFGWQRALLHGVNGADLARLTGRKRANSFAEYRNFDIRLLHERGYPPVVLNYLLNKFLATETPALPDAIPSSKQYSYRKPATRVNTSKVEDFDDEVELTDSQLTEMQDDLDATAPTTDLVRAYLTEIGKVSLLTAEQEVELAMQIDAVRPAMDLLKLIREKGLKVAPEVKEILLEDAVPGIRAANHMLEANLRLVVSLAKRYQGKGLPLLDLIQEGNIGMVRAVEKFDYTKGYKFSTYATWWIRQALQRAIPDKGKMIRIPIHMHETINKTLNIRKQLADELGRPPTIVELGKEVGMTPEKTQEVLEYGKPVVSLDQPVGDGKTKGGQSESTLIDYVSAVVSSPLDEVIALEEQVTRHKLLEQLSPRDSMVLGALYGLGQAPKTHIEIAGVLGCTEGFVKHLEREILKQLRKPEFAPLLQQLAS